MAERAMRDDWGFDSDIFHAQVTPSIVLTLLDECETLATENAKLKTAHPQPFGPEMMKALDAYEKHQDEVPETGMLNAFFILRDSIRVETSATEAFLAEVRAQGVDAAIEHLHNKFEGTGNIGVPVMALEYFAAELRKGGEQ